MLTRNTAIAPAVSKPAAFCGIVKVVRNQKNDTKPPPRLSPSSAAPTTGQSESSNPLGSAWGSMSYVVLNSGIASLSAGHSTIFASRPRHRAPNTADPATVIRSTTCAGGTNGATGCGGASNGGRAGAAETVGLVHALSGISNPPSLIAEDKQMQSPQRKP